MEDTYVQSHRERLNKVTPISKPASLNTVTGDTNYVKRKAYKQPFRKVSTPVQLARPAAIYDAAPFSLPIRNIGYNLNADMKSLKFTPRSGSLPRIVGVESGDGPAPSKELDLSLGGASVPIASEQTVKGVAPTASGRRDSNSSIMTQESDATITGRRGSQDSDATITGRRGSQESDATITGRRGSQEGKISSSDALLEKDALEAAEQAYMNDSQRKEIAGFNQTLSDPTTSVIDRDDKRVIGLRGTASKEDLLTDGALALGRLTSTKRYKRDFEKVRQLVYDAVNQGKTSVVVGGHSLGGALASKITEMLIQEDPRLKNVLKTYTFNEGTSPIAKDKCKGPGCSNIQRQRIKGDVISAGGQNTFRTRESQCKGSISAHGINQFTGRDCKKKKAGVVSRGTRLVEKSVASTAQVVKQFT